MFRAINALAAVLLLLVGGVGSFLTWAGQDPEMWAPNGFTLLAAIGVVLAFFDWRMEERQHMPVSYPRQETDLDHMGER